MDKIYENLAISNYLELRKKVDNYLYNNLKAGNEVDINLFEFNYTISGFNEFDNLSDKINYYIDFWDKNKDNPDLEYKW